MNVEITALAEANLEEIYLRIRKDFPGRAVEWREGLLKAAQTLERFPRRCPLAAESGAELEIRQLVYGAYRVPLGFVKHLYARQRARCSTPRGDSADDLAVSYTILFDAAGWPSRWRWS